MYPRSVASDLDVRTLQHPFLTMEHLCFFLQKSYWQVRDMTLSLALNPAKGLGGNDFVPTWGRPIFRALDIAPLLDPPAREVFGRWQRGEVIVPPLPKDRHPLPLAAVIAANSAIS